MSTDTGYATLDDPDLFAERRRVREKLESLPEGHADGQGLSEAADALDREFCRRASAAWAGEAGT